MLLLLLFLVTKAGYDKRFHTLLKAKPRLEWLPYWLREVQLQKQISYEQELGSLDQFRIGVNAD